MPPVNIHSTNYTNTFITVAEDCQKTTGEMPPIKSNKKSIANYQFELIYNHPYKYTSDTIIFMVFAIRNSINKTDWEKERKKFFSKGQPCLRTSPLCKRYGWGIHCNEKGQIAIYGVETDDYKKFISNPAIKKVRAMNSKRS